MGYKAFVDGEEMEIEWSIEPLSGKYYGTVISIGDNDLTIWGSREWKLSPREIERSKPSPEYSESEIMSDGHYEDIGDYKIACLIEAAPDLLQAVIDLDVTGSRSDLISRASGRQEKR